MPEVHLYGVLESGEPCLIIDDRTRPHFFIRAVDRDRAAALAPGLPLERDGASDARRRAGRTRHASASRATSRPCAAARSARRRCLEADVRFAYRYLIDRGIRGAFEVDGDIANAAAARPRLPQPRRCSPATGRRR